MTAKNRRTFVRHHDLNRCRGGSGLPENRICLEEGREKSFHKLFGNMTVLEAAKLLLFLRRQGFCLESTLEEDPTLKEDFFNVFRVFGRETILKAAELLLELHNRKHHAELVIVGNWICGEMETYQVACAAS